MLAGIGAYKLGANYAPGVVPQKEAEKDGYAQNLWLIGPDHRLTEVCVPAQALSGLFKPGFSLVGWNHEPLCCSPKG